MATLQDDTLLISEVRLATGARWGESEDLQPRQVRGSRIHYSKTKSSKNRTIPTSEELEARLKNALPFKPSYDTFRRAVAAVERDLPGGQLSHVLHATLAMMQKYANFSPWHMAEVVILNPLAKLR